MKRSTSFGFVRVKSLNKYLANVKNLNIKYDNIFKGIQINVF